MDPDQYLAAMLPHAIAEQATYGVPASVSLAQGALESGWGRSVLATVGHNHHGVKASDTPGRQDNPHRLPVPISKTTGEWFGEWTTVVAAFLAFPSAAEGYLGHGWFLRRRGLYDAAFTEATPEGFVRQIAGGGYATDPDYPDKVLSIIDRYDLTQYDTTTTEAPMRIVIMPSSQEHNPCRMGDTEQDHTRLIAARTATLLRQAGQDAHYVVAGDDSLSDSQQLVQMAAASNALKPDLHVDIHTDAGGATGPSAFYIGSGRSKALAEAIYAELKATVPFAANGIRERAGLYMLRQTTASAVLIECWPHDKTEQARWGHANVEAVAQAICRGVLRIAAPAPPAGFPQPSPTPSKEPTMSDVLATRVYTTTLGEPVDLRQAAENGAWVHDSYHNAGGKIRRELDGLRADIDRLAQAVEKILGAGPVDADAVTDAVIARIIARMQA